MASFSTPANPRIVWVGFHEEGHACVPAMVRAGFSIEAIFTLTAEALSKRSGGFDYTTQANEYNIPLYKVDNINDPDAIQKLRELQPDLIFVIGWSQILGPEALASAPLVLGAHASLLPLNRGSAPINWAIINGESQTGNTLIRLREGVDTGEILAQRAFDISLIDSCQTLYQKVAATNTAMVVEVLQKLIAGSLEGKRQSELAGFNESAILPRRRPQDGLIDWHQSSRRIYDFIRAQTRPYPGAFTCIKGTEVRIWTAALTLGSKEQLPKELSSELPGSVSGFFYSPDPSVCGVYIDTMDGAVLITEIEPHGSDPLRGQALIDFFTGITAVDSQQPFVRESV